MRVIEQEMNRAIRERRDWRKDNTTVEIDGNVTRVYLHGNMIAVVKPSETTISLGGWSSNTTKSRLNALSSVLGSYRVFQKDWQMFLEVGSETIEFDSGWYKVS